MVLKLTVCCDSHLELPNISFHENKLDGLDLNSNCLDYSVGKNGRRGNSMVSGRLLIVS